MESIGEKLRLAREKNNYTIEQISRETHVAKRFLKALEDEDFSAFPGETYAMGFLRNYAEYLGLNAEELVGFYKNLKIQEQPLPMTELLDTGPRINLRLILIIAVAAVVVLGGGAYLVYRTVTSRGRGVSESPSRTLLKKETEEFVFQEEVRTKWFKLGDAITVPIGDKTYRLEIASLGDSLTLKIPGGSVDLTVGKERLIDLDGDSRADIKIVWNDTDRTSAEKRVNLGLYRVGGAAAVMVEPPSASGGTQTAAAGGQPPGATGTGASGQAAAQPAAGRQPAAPAGQGAAQPAAAALPQVTTPPVRQAGFKPAVVIHAAQAAPFTIDLLFRDYCLLRFQVDSKDREEQFRQKGETLSLDAKSQVTLWLSNSGAVKAKIAGKDVELGRLGEVAARRISWRADSSSNDNVLEITPLY